MTFQIFVHSGAPDQTSFCFPLNNNLAATIAQVKQTIGAQGTSDRRLGFVVGPLTLNDSDDAVRKLISDSFALGQRTGMAVGFHIDDSMFWDRNSELANRPDNVEWLDWGGTSSTGRRLDWSAEPAQVAPQLCFNSKPVEKVVRARARLIGAAIARQLASLNAKQREQVFAGVIAGWETMLGHDFRTGKETGFHALHNQGYSAANPPSDLDAARVQVVKEFIDLWTTQLAAAGVPANKILCHIAYTPHPQKPSDMGFACPEIAFSPHYLPGFSTYPEPNISEAIYADVRKYGGREWASVEGTNVVPNGMPGEANMETYLGKAFNHGAVMVNLFGWGVGDANNMFRTASEGPQSIAAYRKFLRGELLNETRDPNRFSPEVLQQKVQRIQRELPQWVNGDPQRARSATALMEKLDASIRGGKPLEANHVADQLLQLLNLAP